MARRRPRKAPEPAAPSAPAAGSSPDARRLGAVTLVVLLVLGAAGLVLAPFYDRDPFTAHAAVEAVADGPLGGVRGLHAWSASVVLVLVLVHAARAYVAGRDPVAGRARVLAGVATLAVLVGAYFTGTILPWDQRGWEAYEHLGSGADVVGFDVAPGESPADAPLGVVFWSHVLAVPALLAVGLVLHWRRGVLRGDLASVARLLKEAAPFAGVVVAVLLLLASVAPPALGPAPIPGLEVTRPDWPFLWMTPLQELYGPAALFALPALFALAFAGAALARPSTPFRRRVTVGVLLAAFVALTARAFA